MTMILAILSHTPIWVWFMLAALLALGLLQTRERRVARGRLLALPVVMLALGLWSLWATFVAMPSAAMVWLLALTAFAALGLRIPTPDGARWLAAEKHLLVPGSWIPVAVIVAIFSLRYAVNIEQVLHPTWRTALGAQLSIAALYGAISGLLLGRGLGFLKLTRGSTATPTTIAGHAHA